jgi:hypothetical protein
VRSPDNAPLGALVRLWAESRPHGFGVPEQQPKGACPDDGGKHLVMALREQVWVDESGTHPGSAWCVIAGHRASPRQWKRFDADWRAVLNLYGVSAFHSNEYFNRTVIADPKRNPYLTWSEKRASSYLGDLLDVVRRHRIYPVGCAVDVHAFESYSYRERCVLAGYMTKPSRRKSRDPVPYHLAFRMTLVDAIENAAPNTELHIVIAEQIEYQQRASEAYGLAKKWSLDRRVEQLKGFGMGNPEDEPALQVADLLAGRWCNFLMRGRGRLNRENVTAMNILTHRRRDMPKCDGASIERMFADVGVTEADRKVLRQS